MCTFSTREWASPSSCTQVMGAVQPGWGSFFPCGKRVHAGGHPSCAQVHTWMSARSNLCSTWVLNRQPWTRQASSPPYWAPATQVLVCCISRSFQQDSAVILKLYSPSDDIMPPSTKKVQRRIRTHNLNTDAAPLANFAFSYHHTMEALASGTDLLYSRMLRPTRIFVRYISWHIYQITVGLQSLSNQQGLRICSV